MKNSLIPAGIEPATFGFVEQYLKHWSSASGDQIQLLRSTQSYWTQSQAPTGNSLADMSVSEYILLKT